MSLIALLNGSEAKIAGCGAEDIVYIVVAALGAQGFQIDFRATRKPRRRSDPSAVLITGDSDSIDKLMAEMVMACGIVPVVSEASKPNKTSRSTLVTFSRAESTRSVNAVVPASTS